MIRVINDVGGPAGIASLLYSAIATAVGCGGIVGMVACWLGAAAQGGEDS